MVRIRWFNSAGEEIVRMLARGLHSAEERLEQPAPRGAVRVLVENGARAEWLEVRDGRAACAPDALHEP